MTGAPGSPLQGGAWRVGTNPAIQRATPAGTVRTASMGVAAQADANRVAGTLPPAAAQRARRGRAAARTATATARPATTMDQLGTGDQGRPATWVTVPTTRLQLPASSGARRSHRAVLHAVPYIWCIMDSYRGSSLPCADVDQAQRPPAPAPRPTGQGQLQRDRGEVQPRSLNGYKEARAKESVDVVMRVRSPPGPQEHPSGFC
jgi:hypothetical protein